MIEVGNKVRVLYEGRFEDGSIFDSSEQHNGNPLEFVVGSGTVIPGLEKALLPLDPHVKTTVKIKAKDAFGEYDPDLIQIVPVAGFPNADKLPVGQFVMLDIDGERKRAKVAAVDDDSIKFDFNHEFAGRDIEFDVEIVDVIGETGSLIENEEHAASCQCGCHKLKKQLLG